MRAWKLTALAVLIVTAVILYLRFIQYGSDETQEVIGLPATGVFPPPALPVNEQLADAKVEITRIQDTSTNPKPDLRRQQVPLDELGSRKVSLRVVPVLNGTPFAGGYFLDMRSSRLLNADITDGGSVASGAQSEETVQMKVEPGAAAEIEVDATSGPIQWSITADTGRVGSSASAAIALFGRVSHKMDVREDSTVEVPLFPVQALHGQVIDQAARVGIAGVQVSSNVGHAGVTTDDEGRFSIPIYGVESMVSLRFEHVGYSRKSVWLLTDSQPGWSLNDKDSELLKSESFPSVSRIEKSQEYTNGFLIVGLYPQKVIRGFVVVDGVTPKAGTNLRVTAIGKAWTAPDFQISDEATVEIDSLGSFEIEGLNGQIHHSLYAYSNEGIAAMLVAPGAGVIEVGNLPITLGKFSIPVLDESNQICPGARLEARFWPTEAPDTSVGLHWNDAWSVEGTRLRVPVSVDISGVAHLPICSISAHGDLAGGVIGKRRKTTWAYSDLVGLSALVITKPESARELVGRVLAGKAGKPIAGAAIFINGGSSPETPLTYTNEKGDFRVIGLNPEDLYWLQARTDSGSTLPIMLPLGGQQSGPIKVDLIVE
jgi:hypothetical protein